MNLSEDTAIFGIAHGELRAALFCRMARLAWLLRHCVVETACCMARLAWLLRHCVVETACCLARLRVITSSLCVVETACCMVRLAWLLRHCVLSETACCMTRLAWLLRHCVSSRPHVVWHVWHDCFETGGRSSYFSTSGRKRWLVQHELFRPLKFFANYLSSELTRSGAGNRT